MSDVKTASTTVDELPEKVQALAVTDTENTATIESKSTVESSKGVNESTQCSAAASSTVESAGTSLITSSNERAEQDTLLFERLLDAFFNAKLATKLESEGFAVVENALGEELSKLLRTEIIAMQTSGKMLPNQVRFRSVREGQREMTVSKPHIFEADLHQESVRNSCSDQGFGMLFEEGSTKLVQALNAVGYNRNLIPGAKGVSIKMQYNSGSGGCFPLHYDNPGRPNNRQLTCVVYLNPDWKEGDGGEIELVPFLKAPVRIRPLMGRMVIFRSDLILHRVRPCFAPRYCFTAWIDGNQVNADNEVELRLPKNALNSVPQLAAALARSPIQRLLARAVYQEQFVDSLQLCMGKSDESQEMMESHEYHMQATSQNGPLSMLISKLREYQRQNQQDIQLV